MKFRVEVRSLVDNRKIDGRHVEYPNLQKCINGLQFMGLHIPMMAGYKFVIMSDDGEFMMPLYEEHIKVNKEITFRNND